MATILTAKAGNWSDSTVWTGGVVPGNGDVAVVNHAVVVDVNTVVGPSHAMPTNYGGIGIVGYCAILVNGATYGSGIHNTTTNVLAQNGAAGTALTVAAGVTLTARGNILLNCAPMTMGLNSSLLFDSSLAAAPTACVYSCEAYNSYGATACIFNAIATAGNRITIGGNVPGGGSAGRWTSGEIMTNLPYYESGRLMLSYCNVNYMGTALLPMSTNRLAGPTVAPFNQYTIDHCQFNYCGTFMMEYAGIYKRYVMTITNNTWRNTVDTNNGFNSLGNGNYHVPPTDGSSLGIYFQTGSANDPLVGSSTTISNNYFDKTFGITGLGSSLPSGVTNTVISNNVFAGFCHFGASTIMQYDGYFTFSNNLIYQGGSYFPIASATVSGSTMTVTLNGSFLASAFQVAQIVNMSGCTPNVWNNQWYIASVTLNTTNVVLTLTASYGHLNAGDGKTYVQPVPTTNATVVGQLFQGYQGGGGSFLVPWNCAFTNNYYIQDSPNNLNSHMIQVCNALSGGTCHMVGTIFELSQAAYGYYGGNCHIIGGNSGFGTTTTPDQAYMTGNILLPINTSTAHVTANNLGSAIYYTSDPLATIPLNNHGVSWAGGQYIAAGTLITVLGAAAGPTTYQWHVNNNTICIPHGIGALDPDENWAGPTGQFAEIRNNIFWMDDANYIATGYSGYSVWWNTNSYKRCPAIDEAYAPTITNNCFKNVNTPTYVYLGLGTDTNAVGTAAYLGAQANLLWTAEVTATATYAASATDANKAALDAATTASTNASAAAWARAAIEGSGKTQVYGYSDGWFSSTTPPGVNDIGTSPNFNAQDRNSWTFDYENGGPGTCQNLLAQMQKMNDDTGFNANYTASNLYAYVKAGFIAQNSSYLKGTGYGGVDVGASLILNPLIWTTQPGTIGSIMSGSAVNFQFLASDPNAGYTLTFKANGLPSFLTLSSSGLLTGTLPVVGSPVIYSFSVTATDGQLVSVKNFTLTNQVWQAPTWNSSANLGAFIGGSTHTFNLSATDPQSAPITFSLVSGSTLPGNLTLTSAGVLSGTLPIPSSTTPYSFTIQVTNGNTTPVQQVFTITANAWSAPIFATAPGTLGSYAPGTATITIGTTDPQSATVSYSVTTGSIPSYLTASTVGGNYVLTGTFPPSSNTVVTSFTVTATDGHATSTAAYTITASPYLAPVWSTSTGSIGTVNAGSAFNYTLSASDPQSLSLTYSVTSGSLPSGLNLNGTTGVISGTAAQVASSDAVTFTITAFNGYVPMDRVFSIYVNQTVPVWVTSSLPGGLGGVVYTSTGSTLHATSPFTLTYSVVSGILPNNLVLNPTTGAITGTPTNPASTTTTNFTVRASDSLAHADLALSIQIVGNYPTWVTTAGSLGTIPAGVALTGLAVSATGATSYSIVSGSIPGTSGLIFNTATGAITGTPAEVSSNSTLTFSVGASNGIGSVARSFQLTISPNAPSWGTASNGITAAVGAVQYGGFQLQATSPFALSYSITAGALPTPMQMSAAGLITGTPANVTADTIYNFTVRAYDGTDYSERAFAMTVAANIPNWVTASALGSFQAGQGMTLSLSAPDPQGHNVTYSVTTGSLPSGLHMSTSGQISGTPTEVSTSTVTTFTVTADNAVGQSPQTFTITITPAALTWSTASGALTDATAGSTYSYTIAAQSVFSLTYTVTGSVLPPGLSLNSTTGAITGKPSAVSSLANYSFTVTASDGQVSSPQTFSIAVTPVVPYWNTTGGALTAGITGVAYSQQLSVTSPFPLTYAITSGSLPPGMSIGQTTGLIAGTPSTSGNYSFTVTASDGTTTPVSQSFSIATATRTPIWNTASGLGTISAGVSITTLSVNAQYAASYSLTSGLLPSGLTLNASTGSITGIAAQVSTATGYNFTITAINGQNNVAQAFTLTVNSNPPTFTTASNGLASATAGQSYSSSVIVASPFSLTFSVPANTLPAGLTLNTATGAITGTPAQVSTSSSFTFTITATDGLMPVTRSFSITVAPNPPVWVTTAGTLTGGQPNVTYSSVVLNATSPFTLAYTVVGSLPAGLSLNPATGVIAGTPTTAGTTSFSVAASDGTLSVSRSFSIQIVLNLPIWTTGTGSLGTFTAGLAISNITLNATNAASYVVTSGQLPSGLGMNSSTGVITGIPSKVASAVTSSFTVSAMNGTATSPQQFAITVNPSPPVWITSAGTLTSGVTGNAYSTSFYATSLFALTYRQVSGAFPTGLTLNATSGVLSGTPTVPGVYPFSIMATDGVLSVIESFTITMTGDTITGTTTTTTTGGSGSGGVGGIPTPYLSTQEPSSALVVKQAAGELLSLTCTPTTINGYIMVFDAVSIPSDGPVVPLFTWPCSQQAPFDRQWINPVQFSAGAIIMFSSTGPFMLTASNTAFIAAQAI